MKIAIAMGPWFPVPTVQGGAHHRLWQGLAEEFAAIGHEVTIVCRSYPGQPRTETIQGVRYLRWSGFPQSTNIWFDLLKDLLYALITVPVLPESDILVINDFWLPVFAPLHPLIKKTVISFGRFPKHQFFLYRGADRLSVLSQAIYDEIVSQSPTASVRTSIIPNPVNTLVFKPPALPKPKRAEKVILYVGRLHPEKGVHLLLEAFEIVSRQSAAKLRIVGPFQENQGGGGEKYRNQLKQKAEGLNVEFFDPVFDVHQLAQHYQDADLFCYPSLAEKGEAFGVAPLEAMSCGLVPIVSDLSCFKDYIENDRTGYIFDHRDSQAAQNLACVLTSAISNWERTVQVAHNATQRALSYSYQHIAQRYLSDFEQLLFGSK